ncbi:MAG: SPOR domain-containing protein [Bacteroidales bacterium]|nr:SPOR domain-containing protein [Bacteroidales bacterium]
MNKIILAFAFMLFLTTITASAQSDVSRKEGKGEQGICLTQDEMVLYNLINDMRKQNKLAILPLSGNLCIVARTHIEDLISWKPQDQGCTLNSWSSNGKWSACCNGKDPSSTRCMNNKPSELTSYSGLGFELVYWEEESATAYEAYESWKQLDASREMLLGKGKWQSKSWKAIGVSIKDGYALIWLGDKQDVLMDIGICGSDTLVQSMKKGNVNPNVVPAAERRKPSETEAKPAEISQVKQTPASSDNPFYVIVASLKTEQLAREKIAELKLEGYKDIILVTLQGKFRISIGSYPTEAKAKSRMKELKVRFPDCWLLHK